MEEDRHPVALQSFSVGRAPKSDVKGPFPSWDDISHDLRQRVKPVCMVCSGERTVHTTDKGSDQSKKCLISQQIFFRSWEVEKISKNSGAADSGCLRLRSLTPVLVFP